MSWDREEAARLYALGFGPREIARQVDGPYTTVYDFITGKRKDAEVPVSAKILVADIETAPFMAYAWRRWKTDIRQDFIVSEGYVLCWAAKWLGSTTVMTDSLFKNKTAYWRDPEDDTSVCKSLWQLFDQADVVIFHNGDRFDIPVMNTRFIQHGLQRPSPYKSIDTLKIAKRAFKFPSNALNSIGIYLGLGEKQETGGAKLWTACMKGDSEAWKKMVDYCVGDIDLLEKVYMHMRHWDHQHPNLALYESDKSNRCGVCTSTQLVPLDNDHHTGMNRFQTYRCKSCGAVSRSRVSALSTEDRAQLLATVPK